MTWPRQINRSAEAPLAWNGARYTADMDNLGRMYEQLKVSGRDLAKKIGDLIREGNVRRIIVRDERGNTFMEIPLTVATLGIVAAPVLAAVGAIATVVSNFEVVVERSHPASQSETHHSAASHVGATEDEVDMK